MRRLLLLLLLTGCSTTPPPPATGDAIYHYIRSNRDGSEPEHVVQFRPARTRIAVYKWVEKCTTAAYVTAVMDGRLREGRLFTAGKVARDGSQVSFGTLALDGFALVAEVDPPGSPHISARHQLKSRPYLLYDFDFADLNAFLQTHQPRADFAFQLPVVWPGKGGLFKDYGQLHARYAALEQRLGRLTVRFDLAVDGDPRSAGALWIDAARGFIVEAELGLPNHQEYRDFRLRLERVERGGRPAWDALTRSQYSGCPAGN